MSEHLLTLLEHVVWLAQALTCAKLFSPFLSLSHIASAHRQTWRRRKGGSEWAPKLKERAAWPVQDWPALTVLELVTQCCEKVKSIEPSYPFAFRSPPFCLTAFRLLIPRRRYQTIAGDRGPTCCHPVLEQSKSEPRELTDISSDPAIHHMACAPHVAVALLVDVSFTSRLLHY